MMPANTRPYWATAPVATGKDLSGGVTLMTPFGKLVTPNITPDKDTGIGNYTADDFLRRDEAGRGAGRQRLYPAMSYPYALRADERRRCRGAVVLASGRQAGSEYVDVNQLHFLFNMRVAMAGWDALFFDAGSHAGDPARNATWNRGAYLVNGLAHCGACHSPKNIRADKGPLTGAVLQGWYAPDSQRPQCRTGSLSTADIVDYLKTGRNAHSIASGPMAEAVENSSSQMNDADLTAIAVYLKDLPASHGTLWATRAWKPR